MAKIALVHKAAMKPKFAVRGYTRCQRCGRPHAVFRKFGLCRICLREMAHAGEQTGVSKSSWYRTSHFPIQASQSAERPTRQVSEDPAHEEPLRERHHPT